MITAYQKLGLTELAQDAERVLAVNLQNGALDVAASEYEEDKSLGQAIWDYLELDKN